VFEAYRAEALDLLKSASDPVLSLRDTPIQATSSLAAFYADVSKQRGELSSRYKAYKAVQVPGAYNAEAYFTRLQKDRGYQSINDPVEKAYLDRNKKLLKALFDHARSSAMVNDRNISATYSTMNKILADLKKDEFYKNLKKSDKYDFDETYHYIKGQHSLYVFKIQNQYPLTLGLGAGYDWNVGPYPYYFDIDLTRRIIPLVYLGLDFRGDFNIKEGFERGPMYLGGELGFYYYIKNRMIMPYVFGEAGVVFNDIDSLLQFNAYFKVGGGLKFFNCLYIELDYLRHGFSDFFKWDDYRLTASAGFKFKMGN
jgi:hypothetical protein